jgi:hypothetical protein
MSAGHLELVIFGLQRRNQKANYPHLLRLREHQASPLDINKSGNRDLRDAVEPPL